MGALALRVPRELPRRADGSRIAHLSASSVELLLRCPERWRRRYIAMERAPSTGAQHLGACVDEAVAEHFRARLRGDVASESDALGRFRDAWARGLLDREVVFADDAPAGTLLDQGRAALSLYLREQAARLEPEAVQRRFELVLWPEVSWTLVGYPDLETTDGRVVDLKVKARHLSQAEADASLQAGAYLLAREREGRPATFTFHSLRREGADGPSLRELHTRREPRQLNGLLVRVALAARLAVELAERFGPEGPWPLADPQSIGCSARLCPAWHGCPGGAGL